MHTAANGSHPIYDPIRDPGGYRTGARIARVQILVALFLGTSAFSIFCVLRKRFPRIYVANLNSPNKNYLHSFSRQNLPRLPNSLLSWVPVVYRISEEQVLEHAGLDAVVFLGFFKMCIGVLAVCVLFAFTVISPVRYRFTGRVDFPDPGDDNLSANSFLPGWIQRGLSFFKHDDSYESFLWMYSVFTYVFTFVLLYFLHRQTIRIIAMRQQYLGRQCAITDRTIKISGIPPLLREEATLRRHINSLGVGEVDSVCIVKEWNSLNDLFRARKRVLHRLEAQWVEYFRRNNIKNLTELSDSRFRSSVGDAYSLHEPGASNGSSSTNASNRSGSISPPSNNSNGSTSSNGALSPITPAHVQFPYSDNVWDTSSSASVIDRVSEHLEEHSPSPAESTSHLSLLGDSPNRPTFRKGWFGLFGPKVDAINYYNGQLDVIDKEIKRHRLREFAPSSTAFVTMKSVAQAQMLAQAVLDPKIHHLITSLAPAPHDILWDNMCLTRKERNTRIFFVMVFIGLVSVLLVLPVRFLSNFLNIKSISKVAPKLAEFLKAHRWAANLITGILPPYVFTILNIIMPYFYIWITKHQGYTSRGDEELSAVSKNFFYIFVNLFLVFTLFGTAILTDTAQLAYQLADSLKKLSLFYVDLIILQGIGIFPYKLLLLGNLLKYPIKNMFWCKTPRNYLDLYKPPVFNFGLQLPQPILILIITFTYSVISTKILTAGLIYFLIGYFVFKYQLLYACVHPPHNTGKVWPLVVRRVILGLLIFHTMMFGTLASEKAYACASALVPLPIFTIFVFWYFHKHYIPLSSFIALRSIENNQLPFHADEEDALFSTETANSARAQTLDERREFNQTYEYPYLVSDLDGPLVAVDLKEALYINSDGGLAKKRIPTFQ